MRRPKPLSEKSITQELIARKLKLSIATVSRALADSPKVKVKTKERVLQLARELEYSPNFIARSLQSGQTKTIGVITPQIAPEFFGQVLRGVEDAARQKGYRVVICSSDQSLSREIENVSLLRQGIIDGVIVGLTKESLSYAHLKAIQDFNIPLVLFDNITDSIEADKVVINDEDGGYRATAHLISQGNCRRIAFIGGPRSLKVYQDRYRGYQKALRDYGIREHAGCVIFCGEIFYEKDKKTIQAFLNNLKKMPDGIFAGNDLLAVSAIKSLKNMGVRIPKDLKIVGFGNLEIGIIYEPSITTIDQPAYSMGQEAVSMLLGQIQGGENYALSTKVLQTRLIVRESG